MVQRIKSAIKNFGGIICRYISNAISWLRCRNDNRNVCRALNRAAAIEKEDGELVIVYGGLGVGKTTYLCQIGKSFEADGRQVFTNIPDTPFQSMPPDYYKYRYPRGSCILIDEIGILHDNRQYKTLPEEVRDWYKYVRHHGLHVFAASQTADVDKKIRVLATEQELLKKETFLFFFTLVKKYLIIPEIGYIDKESGRFYAEDYYTVIKRSTLRLRKFYSLHNSHSELDIPLYEGVMRKEKVLE